MRCEAWDDFPRRVVLEPAATEEGAVGIGAPAVASGTSPPLPGSGPRWALGAQGSARAEPQVPRSEIAP